MKVCDKMKEIGCKINELIKPGFQTIKTSRSESIVDGLIRSGIKFSAKYDAQKLIIAFSEKDKKTVSDIIEKSQSESADFIERLRSGSENINEYISLIPEIANVIGVSASAFESRPAEIRLLLAQTYVDNWYCDQTTIRKELKKITDLDYSAETELKESEKNHELDNNTPEIRNNIRSDEQKLNTAAETEREIYRQQRSAVTREEKRIRFFSVEMLRHETQRIKKRSQTQEQESQKEMERSRKKCP